MADKPGRFEGLVVNFQNLPPKSSEPQIVIWLKWLGFWMVVLGIAALIAWLI